VVAMVQSAALQVPYGAAAGQGTQWASPSSAHLGGPGEGGHPQHQAARTLQPAAAALRPQVAHGGGKLLPCLQHLLERAPGEVPLGCLQQLHGSSLALAVLPPCPPRCLLQLLTNMATCRRRLECVRNG
jgi:hypothetical protein